MNIITGATRNVDEVDAERVGANCARARLTDRMGRLRSLADDINGGGYCGRMPRSNVSVEYEDGSYRLYREPDGRLLFVGRFERLEAMLEGMRMAASSVF